MGRKKGAAIRREAADKRRANAAAEVAAADAIAAALAEAAAAAAAKVGVKGIIPSPVPISICGLREAQILAVKLGPGALVKVRSVAAKDAAALVLLLERQMKRKGGGWKVPCEDLRALEHLSVAYLLANTAIDADYPVVRDNLASPALPAKRGYLLAFKDWSLLFEDVAARVPSVGMFKVFAEARNVSKLARKVVVGSLSGERDLAWLGARLDRIGEGLEKMINCTVEFPNTVQKMRAKEKEVMEAEKKRREKAEKLLAADAEAVIPVPVPVIPEAEGEAAATVATEIWGLRAGHILSLTLAAGSAVKVRSVALKNAMSLCMLLGSHSQQGQGSWIVRDEDLLGLSDVDACYHLLNTAVETHLAIFSTLTRQDLSGNTGYMVAFCDWVREFQDRARRVPSEGRDFDFAAMAADLCNAIRQLLAEAANCSRAQVWFEEKLALITQMMNTLMESTIYFPAE